MVTVINYCLDRLEHAKGKNMQNSVSGQFFREDHEDPEAIPGFGKGHRHCFHQAYVHIVLLYMHAYMPTGRLTCIHTRSY